MWIKRRMIVLYTILSLPISSEAYAQVVSFQFYRPIENMYKIVTPCMSSAKLWELAREASLHVEEVFDYNYNLFFQIRVYGPLGILDNDVQPYAALSVYIVDDRAISKQYVFFYRYVKGSLEGHKEIESDRLEDWGYYKCFPARAP